MKHKLTMLAVAGVVAASVTVSMAQPYYVVGNYNGWNNPAATAMTDDGIVNGLQRYSYQITGQTPNAHPADGLKVTDGTWNNTAPNGNNMQYYTDGSGNVTVYYFPGNISDGWSPLNGRVGYSAAGNSFEFVGDFTNPNWASDPLAQLVDNGSGVLTNTYIIATPGTHNFKFRTPGSWDNVNFGATFDNGSGNAVVTTTTANEAILFKLDLPNGRWQAGGPPVYCDVQFSVDMSVVAASDPGYDYTTVTVNGGALAPNGWGGTICTNDPSAVNTNIFTSPKFNIIAGSSVDYQFRYLSSGITVYDALNGVSGQNRNVTVPVMASTNIPAVYFNDALPTDLLNQDTTVTFTVNMTNAVGTDSTIFDNVSHAVFINGVDAWLTWAPLSLSAWQPLETPLGSYVYQLTKTFPKGHPRALTYKYAIDGLDNEAGFAQNHFRYIRSTNGVYNLPMDTFGNQYNEQKLGGLTINHVTGTTFNVIWQPYPNVHLQYCGNLSVGSWLDMSGTTGTTGSNPTVTNTTLWGESAVYFRLKQP